MAYLKDEVLLRKIALAIKELQKKSKLTLDDFYVDTGIHLARVEQGKTNISISTLSKICTYFNIDLSDFFKKIKQM